MYIFHPYGGQKKSTPFGAPQGKDNHWCVLHTSLRVSAALIFPLYNPTPRVSSWAAPTPSGPRGVSQDPRTLAVREASARIHGP